MQEKQRRRSYILERTYIKEGKDIVARSKERKREKSEDNLEGVVVLLIKMNTDRGRIQVFFLALSYCFNLVSLVDLVD